MGYVQILANQNVISEFVLPEDTSVLFKSEFKDGAVQYCKFVDVKILNCKFDHALCKNVDFSDTEFYEGSYELTKMINCDFYRARFDSCIFIRTYFKNCNFRKASFGNCRFIDCSFEDCDLGFGSSRTPEICGGEIRNCINIPPIPMACPEKGEFTGYKKALINPDNGGIYSDVVIVKLKIPAKAKRSSGLGRKCRCSEAKVAAIYAIKRTAYALSPGPAKFVKDRGSFGAKGVDYIWRNSLGNKLDPNVVAYSKFATRVQGLPPVRYIVGKTVYADEWDDDRFNECSHGIHFFMSAQEAVDY